jgi:hypothetical protein
MTLPAMNAAQLSGEKSRWPETMCNCFIDANADGQDDLVPLSVVDTPHVSKMPGT